MKSIPNTNFYFFQHQSEEGYTIALHKSIAGYSVEILQGDHDLLIIEARRHEDVEFIYETLYKWLAYCPGDVPKKCLKLKEALKSADNLAIAFQLLPLKDVSIAFPDLNKLEFEEFKKKVKK